MRWSPLHGAAAGGAATGATANPLAGAAAGAAARKTTEELLTELLPAQQQALEELLERTQGMEMLLGSIRSDITTLLDVPWRTAHLHMEYAARHADQATDELRVARNYLYEAWSASTASARRALIGQELTLVYALCGELADSREWLWRSYEEQEKAVREAAMSLISTIDDLPHLRPIRTTKTRNLFEPGSLHVQSSTPHNFFTPPEPLCTSLRALVGSLTDGYLLRLSCALARIPKPWPAHPSTLDVEGGWSPRGSCPTPFVKVYTGRRGWGMTGFTVSGEPDSPLPVDELSEITGWHFTVRHVPFTPPLQLFVSGSSPELGQWRVDQAMPMKYSPGPLNPDGWSTSLLTLESDRPEPVQYKYLHVPEPGGLPIWEDGPNRLIELHYPFGGRDPGRLRFRTAHDDWRQAEDISS